AAMAELAPQDEELLRRLEAASASLSKAERVWLESTAQLQETLTRTGDETSLTEIAGAAAALTDTNGELARLTVEKNATSKTLLQLETECMAASTAAAAAEAEAKAAGES